MAFNMFLRRWGDAPQEEHLGPPTVLRWLCPDLTTSISRGGTGICEGRLVSESPTVLTEDVIEGQGQLSFGDQQFPNLAGHKNLHGT